MPHELTNIIKDFIEANSLDCRLIKETGAVGLIKKLAGEFNGDLSMRYLWESVSAKEAYPYSDGQDWKNKLEDLLTHFKDRVYVVVTDDEFYPWAVFDCKKSQLIELLESQQYFEYFVFDELMGYILFDTHMNELLFANRKL